MKSGFLWYNGNTKIVANFSLTYGLTKSCGCYRKEYAKANLTTHGLKNTRLYSIYKGMKDRCRYNNDAHKRYCGRGIKVCQEWLADFMNFYNWAINNGYKEGLTLDRIDSNGNYEPTNCRWATYKEQANNTRRNNMITYNNETHTLTEWSEILGIKRPTLSSRIHRQKMSIEKAFTMPVITNQFG